MEEDEENLAVPTVPKYEPCPEDDDFLAALDKMVNENIAESKNVGRYRVSPSQLLTDRLTGVCCSAGQEQHGGDDCPSEQREE